nr:VOC family protein [uncultured Gellertiella sp.]
MKTLGLNHINIRAPRPLLEDLRDFYRDVVGLAEGFRPPFAGFGYWLYAGDQPVVHLYETAPEDIRTSGVAVPLDHFAFSCEDRADFEATLSRLAIPHVSKTIPQTGHGQIFVTDPAGNRVELQFARHDQG